jgi:hypothetical protein
MTDTTPTPPLPTPPDDPRRVQLPDLDRSQVQAWVQRHADNPHGRWVPVASPEARTSARYHVCAQLVSGEWVRVMWGQGVGGGGGVEGNRGGGRKLGSKNSKPRKDKGLPRSKRNDP